MPDKSGQQVMLGERYRDTITEMTGTATARAEYLNDMPSVYVEFSPDDMGRPVEGRWIPEARLERIENEPKDNPDDRL